MQEKVEKFLNELRNYHRNIKDIQALKTERSVLFDILKGVKGIRYDLYGTSTNTLEKELKKHEIRDRMKAIDDEIQRLTANNDYIESILNNLDPEIKTSCIRIYCAKESYETVSRDLHISTGSLQYRIIRQISMYL